jgi:polyhydroxyalkanoate synthesis regulator phasin
MGYDITYKKVNGKEYIEEQLIKIIDTVRNKGQIYTGEWAEYIDDNLKEQSSSIEQIINKDRMIFIIPKQIHSRCDIVFDDSLIEKEGTFRGFTKEELKEFIEALQLAYEQT